MRGGTEAVRSGYMPTRLLVEGGVVDGFREKSHGVLVNHVDTLYRMTY